MSSIDEVIERSRQAGQFSERKRFTVARSRAIQKMRQFALADRWFYVLEWIQAAVANGATYLDLAIEDEEVRMSYVGGGFARDELEALFDFLFASKDDLDVADVRQLALGVNALLSAEPEAIVIESGDGTLEGTTRVELDGRSDSVYVGTPMKALEGTYVRATGLRREPWTQPKELKAIEERCLTATIPILVNDAPLFGYSAIRSPELFGYRRTLKFDEGDLYGTIGLATTPITKNFKLLTWGTWITTDRHQFAELPEMGGVVGYDRLRKTADHANIVRDEVYNEMWARLSSYARQLAAGQTGKATFDASMLDGPGVKAQQFRSIVRERGRVVVFRREAVQTEDARMLAGRYGDAFDAPVFLVGDRDYETVMHLGGPEVEVHTPKLDAAELSFFERKVAEDPPRPWLTASIEVPSVMPDVLAHRLEAAGASVDGVAAAARALRASTSLKATVFTPAALGGDVDLWAELRIARRIVWCGSIESAYPGHHLVIELGEFPFEMLRGDSAAAIAPLIAQTVARQADEQLSQATGRVVELMRPDQPLSSAARRIVLGVVCRSAIKRLRRTSDGVVMRFALDSDALPNVLLELGVLETLSGTTLSFRDIERLLPETYGLVYVARPGAAVSSAYDHSRIVIADAPAERMLVGLVGQQSLVRLGSNIVLASHGELRCSEIALGLREYATFPLAVDGNVPDDDLSRRDAIDALARQLLSAWLTGAASRHVLRHLILFVARGAGTVHSEIVRHALFRAADGRAVSFANIRSLLESDDGLPMYDGWSSELTAGSPVATDGPLDAPLAMEPFVFGCLSRAGTIRPVLDVDLTAAEASGNETRPNIAFLESEVLDVDLTGAIGIPVRAVEEPVILWLQREQGTAVALRDVATEFGVVGRIVGPSSLELSRVTRQCVAACQAMYDRLIRRIPSIASDSKQFSRALEVVLSYAARRIRITEGPDGSLGATVIDPLAQRILDLPVFPTTAGVSVPGWRLLREFTTYGDRRARPGRAELADNARELLAQWLDEVLDPESIAPHPTASPAVGPPSELDRWLTQALEELRTDDDDREVEVRVLATEQYAVWTAQFGISDPDMFVDDATVYISRDSWLVSGILRSEGMPDPESASWLLLAIYARINKLRLSVTNVHELHFQSRILDWLER